MNPLSSYLWLNNNTAFFFYKDGSGSKYPIKVDMVLNKETKPDITNMCKNT